MLSVIDWFGFTLIVFLIILLWAFVRSAAKGYRSTDNIRNFFILANDLEWNPFILSVCSTIFSVGNFIVPWAVFGYFYGKGAYVLSIIVHFFNFLGWQWFSKHVENYTSIERYNGSVHEFIFLSYSDATQNQNGKNAPEDTERPGDESEPSTDEGNGGEPAQPGRSPKTEQAERLRTLAAVPTLIGLVLVLLLEVFVGAEILHQTLGTDLMSSLIFIIAIMSFYTAIGGYRAVIDTDIIQFWFVVIGAALATLFISTIPDTEFMAYSDQFKPGFIQPVISSGQWIYYISVIVMSAGWFIVSMDIWQRNKAANFFRTSDIGNKISAAVLCLISFFFIWIGIQISLLDIDTGNPIIAALELEYSGALYSICMGVFAVSILAATFSTADTFLSVATHTAVIDLLFPWVGVSSYNTVSEKEGDFYLSRSRILVLFIGLGASLVGAVAFSMGLLSDAFNLFFVAYSVQYALLLVVIMPIFGFSKIKPAKYAVICGVISSFVFGVILIAINAYGISSILGHSVSTLIGWIPLITVIFPFITIVATYPFSK